MSSALVALLIIVFLFITYVYTDEVEVDRNWLSEQIGFPCTHAELLKATYDTDYNTVDIRLHIADRTAFEKSLRTAGYARQQSDGSREEWTHAGDDSHISYLYITYEAPSTQIYATYRRLPK